MSKPKPSHLDRYRYRAHVQVTVTPVTTDEAALITVEVPLNLQAIEAIMTAALAGIHTMAEIDPTMLDAGKKVLAGLPKALEQLAENWTLMPVRVVLRETAHQEYARGDD